MVVVLIIVLFAVSAAVVGVSIFEMKEKTLTKTKVSERLKSANAEHKNSSGFLSEHQSDTDINQNTGGLGALIRRFANKTFAVSKSKDANNAQMVALIPELIDVVNLGIMGGLSFETAFLLYTSKFDNCLAKDCKDAAAAMASGVETKQAALANLSKQIDIPEFSRFVRIVLRTTKMGSVMTESLARLADDIRASSKANVEEKISKMPTKMMVPTGVLILPAMMMLIGAPFLLNFVQSV